MPASLFTRRWWLASAWAHAALASVPPGPNIRWGLGMVTWVTRAQREKRPLGWPEILADIARGGFQGFEPYTQSA